MTLTVESSVETLDLLSFTFGTRKSKSGLNFTLFLRTDCMNSLAVMGSLFSREHKERVFDYLKSKSQQDNEHEEDSKSEEAEDQLMIRDNRGNQFRVVVTIQAKTVHHWQVFTVGIGAVQVQDEDRYTDSSSSPRSYTKAIGL
jgi:hypothetical protein